MSAFPKIPAPWMYFVESICYQQSVVEDLSHAVQPDRFCSLESYHSKLSSAYCFFSPMRSPSAYRYDRLFRSSPFADPDLSSALPLTRTLLHILDRPMICHRGRIIASLTTGTASPCDLRSSLPTASAGINTPSSALVLFSASLHFSSLSSFPRFPRSHRQKVSQSRQVSLDQN